MEIFLFKVQDIFLISGRGLVLSPGPGDKVKYIKTGTEIRLKRADNSEFTTTIIGISFEGNHDILISPTFKKEDIPIGTEVWIA